MAKFLQSTAAWRISIWSALVFAIGTIFAFSIVYFLVAQGIQKRSDAWLRGEAEFLAQVSANTPRDSLYSGVLKKAVELEKQELPDERNPRGQQLNIVFFLESDPGSNEGPLWVGPGSADAFLKAIRRAKPVVGVPQSISIDGWPTAFRVVARNENGNMIYLGLYNRGSRHLLLTLIRRFLALWGSTVLMGFLVSFISAHRTLLRVQRITDKVARISSEDLGERLTQPINSDEISRLSQTFNHMLDRIQTSVNELRTITDSVAHDLKSPITSIRGTLESAISNQSDGNWRDSVGDAIEGLDRLLRALDTTLDVAEAQAGALHLNLSAVDLSAAVKQLVDLYQPAMDEHQHELIVDLEGRVVVDADLSLLNRVLSNLIENEIAHLPAGCRITIRLRSEQGSAKLVIEDNGPGFPPDIGARAFERFVRGKDSRGHGLGLAFVDAVVRVHGGTAKVSDSPAGGAVVTLSLPAFHAA